MANNSSSSNALKDAINARKASLEAELKAFEGSNVDKLFAERDQLSAKLADVEAKIADLSRHLGVGKPGRPAKGAKRGPKPGAARAGKKRRTRMSSQEIKDRIYQALGSEKAGLSQKAISEFTAISYGTVAAFLKANAPSFKSTGKLKSKLYFLK